MAGAQKTCIVSARLHVQNLLRDIEEVSEFIASTSAAIHPYGVDLQSGMLLNLRSWPNYQANRVKSKV